jgi:beta-galactosidase
MVIICPGAFGANLEKQAETLHSWLEKGGKLLCMEQKAVGKVPFLNQLRLEASNKSAAEPVEPTHPAFVRLERIKDMDTMNGNNGGAFTHMIMPPSEAVLALAWNQVDMDSAAQARLAMSVAEIRESEGVCLMNQLLVTSRYDSDPQARRFVQQLIAYFVSPEMGKFARPAIGKHKARVLVDESRVFFVDLSKQANRGFVDEVAADGKGGWDDGGPENDMRAFKTGKQRLAGVPFDIINPTGNNGRGCIVLSGGILVWAPTAASGIPVNQKSKAFNFLHAYGYGKDGETCAKYIVKYDDGSIVEIPLVCGKNIASWWGSWKLDDAEVAWSGKNPSAGTIGVYSYRWQNPHPDKKVATIDFVSMNTGNTIPILVAITGEN